MRLMQALMGRGTRVVVATNVDGASDPGHSWIVQGWRTVYELALAAMKRQVSLEELVRKAGRGRRVEAAELLQAARVLSPIDHPDPAHLLVSGTGLTHLGSAIGRDAMHTAARARTKAKRSPRADKPELLTDSMKMFRMGVEGGKAPHGRHGVQPEWFYKGDGSCVVAPGQALVSESFALDAGEEPEVAGIYVIQRDGTPYRVGYVLLNEFSDHVTERQNYLWLAHSKLRPCSFGPQILLGPLPQDVRGISRIRRGRRVIFEQPFHTGEVNMSHSLANLEWHHFKYPAFRRPGDIHVHTFGTATLSFTAGVKTRFGDRFELECPMFGLPLVNSLAAGAPARVVVRSL